MARSPPSKLARQYRTTSTRQALCSRAVPEWDWAKPVDGKQASASVTTVRYRSIFFLLGLCEGGCFSLTLGPHHGALPWRGRTPCRGSAAWPTSHPENAEARRRYRRIQGCREAQRQHAARFLRRDDAVVPQPRGRVKRIAFGLVLGAHRYLERLLLCRAPGLARGLDIVAPYRRQHRGRLLAAHDRDARVGPGEQKPRTVGAPAHASVAGAVAPADDQRDLRHLRAGHRRHHLGAVLGNAAGLVLPPHHEAGNILQEQKRDSALTTQLDEMRGLERRFRKQNSVVAENANRHTVQMRKAGDDRRCVELLELIELRAVDQAPDHLAHVVLLAQIGGHDAVEIDRVERRLARRLERDIDRLLRVQMADDAPRQRKRM